MGQKAPIFLLFAASWAACNISGTLAYWNDNFIYPKLSDDDHVSAGALAGLRWGQPGSPWTADLSGHVLTDRSAGHRSDLASLSVSHLGRKPFGWIQAGVGFGVLGDLGGGAIQKAHHALFNVDPLSLPYHPEESAGPFLSAAFLPALWRAGSGTLHGELSARFGPGGLPGRLCLAAEGEHNLFRTGLGELRLAARAGWVGYYSSHPMLKRLFGAGVFGGVGMDWEGETWSAGLFMTGNQYGRGYRPQFGGSLALGVSPPALRRLGALHRP